MALKSWGKVRSVRSMIKVKIIRSMIIAAPTRLKRASSGQPSAALATPPPFSFLPLSKSHSSFLATELPSTLPTMIIWAAALKRSISTVPSITFARRVFFV